VCFERLFEDAAGAELRGHQAGLCGHGRRRKFGDSGSERDARAGKSEEGRQRLTQVGLPVEAFQTFMKQSFVSDLTSEQNITTFFLVCEKEVRSTKEGKQYLRLELGDRSGTIEARMWDQIEVVTREVEKEDIVKVQGRVEIYRGRPQFSVIQMRKAKPEEIDLADYLPSTKEDVEKLYKQLLAEADSIKNPWLKKLNTFILCDPGISVRYKRAPAAKVMHHAYLGGLLEHVVGLCGLAHQIAQHYPELDVDLLLTAAILHDVGKLDELCYDRAIGYTTEGQLLGHIVMEIETVTRAMEKIEGF